MTLRFLAEDPMVEVAPGWCETQPGDPPPSCSWCGAEYQFKNDGGVAHCPACDGGF